MTLSVSDTRFFLVGNINTAHTLYFCCKLQHRVVHSHFLLCGLSFSVEQYSYFLNKFDYSYQLRAVKSIKSSFFELPYSSYYPPRYFPRQRYKTALFYYRNSLAHQFKFKPSKTLQPLIMCNYSKSCIMLWEYRVWINNIFLGLVNISCFGSFWRVLLDTIYQGTEV